MPKVNRENTQKFNNRMVKMFPYVLDIESSILFCKLCQCNINGCKVFSVQQHFRTMKHKAALELDIGELCVSPSPPRTIKYQLDNFSLDLCTTLLECNIPLDVVENPAVQMFLQKYTEETIPNEALLRAEYIPALYEKYVQKLQYKAKNKRIWISVTEAIDSELQLSAYFVFGVLGENERGKSYLLHVDRLERANASSFAAFFNNSLHILWPEKILYENIYLVVTDAIPYMMTAMQPLKILYPNMIYVNCLLQSFDRLLQFIRAHFSHVDSFISSCEGVFLKSPHRLHIMRSKYHYLTLPSITDSTATPSAWLNAAIYYYNNYMEIHTLINMLSEEDDAECIQKARELIKKAALETDLMYIKQNFECLSKAIKQLKSRKLTLSESLATIDTVKTYIQETKRFEFINKLQQILNENPGLQQLAVINSSNNLYIERKSNNSREKSLLYKFVPIVSADIDSLSYAKSLLEKDKKKSNDFKSSKKDRCETLYIDSEVIVPERPKSPSAQLDDVFIKQEVSLQEITIDSSHPIKCESNTYNE